MKNKALYLLAALFAAQVLAAETYKPDENHGKSDTKTGEKKDAPPGQDKKDGKEAKKADPPDDRVVDPSPTLNELDFIALWASAAKANRITKDQEAQCKDVIDTMRKRFYSNIDKWTWNDFMARMRVVNDLKKIDKTHGPWFVWRGDDTSPLVAWCGKSKTQAELLSKIAEIGKVGLMGTNGYKFMIAQYMEGQRLDLHIDKARCRAWLKNLKSGAPACCHKAIDDLLDD